MRRLGIPGTAAAALRAADPLIAGATFTLYLFHVPLLHAVVALAPWPAETWPTRALVFIGVPLLVLALAEVTERRKGVWRRGILAVLSKQGWALPRPARGQAPGP